MKRFLIATVLAGLLAVPAIAGDISTSGSPAPPPSGATHTTTSTSLGDIPTVPGEIPSLGTAEQISDGALSALLLVFGLLG
jgi:hypothetical protein